MTQPGRIAKASQALALAFVGAVLCGFTAHVLATKVVGEADGSDLWWSSGAGVGAIVGALRAAPLRRNPRQRRRLGILGPVLTFGGALLGLVMYFAAEHARRSHSMFAGLGEALLCVLGCTLAAIGLALWIASAVGGSPGPQGGS